MENISKLINNRKATAGHQPGFMMGKSCWTNLIVFYDEMTILEDEGTAKDCLALDFSKDIESYNISQPLTPPQQDRGRKMEKGIRAVGLEPLLPFSSSGLGPLLLRVSLLMLNTV